MVDFVEARFDIGPFVFGFLALIGMGYGTYSLVRRRKITITWLKMKGYFARREKLERSMEKGRDAYEYYFEIAVEGKPEITKLMEVGQYKFSKGRAYDLLVNPEELGCCALRKDWKPIAGSLLFFVIGVIFGVLAYSIY